MNVRRESRFRQRDITAAIKAAERAGKEVFGVKIAKDGTIEVITSREMAPSLGEINEWDEEPS